MKVTHPEGIITIEAGGTINAGDVVKFGSSTTAGKAIKTTAANDIPFGIALDKATAGEMVPVKILGSGGTVLLRSGGAISQGAQIAANATATAAATDVIIGIALEASSGSSAFIEIAHQAGQVK